MHHIFQHFERTGPTGYITLSDAPSPPREVAGGNLAALIGMPLRNLSLRGRVQWATDDCMEALVDMPLSRLDLGFCCSLTDAGLERLGDVPLTALNLKGCGALSGECRERFGGLQEAWDASE